MYIKIYIITFETESQLTDIAMKKVVLLIASLLLLTSFIFVLGQNENTQAQLNSRLQHIQTISEQLQAEVSPKAPLEKAGRNWVAYAKVD